MANITAVDVGCAKQTAPKRLIKKPELAQAVSLSGRYIEHLVAQERIPYVRLGRRCLLFDLDEVVEALKKGAQ